MAHPFRDWYNPFAAIQRAYGKLSGNDPGPYQGWSLFGEDLPSSTIGEQRNAFTEGVAALNTRPSMGVQGDNAWQQTARAVQQLINQNLLENTIPTLNREWANRYQSGQRNQAIQGATNEAQRAGANALAQLALQQWTSQTGFEEERAWRQAMLDMQPSWWENMLSSFGQAAPYIFYALLK